MTTTTPVLTDSKTLNEVVNCLTENIPIQTQGNEQLSKPLRLAWVGEEMPPIEEVWRLYLRRFTIDHWYRFLKQRLHWTVPYTTLEGSINSNTIIRCLILFIKSCLTLHCLEILLNDYIWLGFHHLYL